MLNYCFDKKMHLHLLQINDDLHYGEDYYDVIMHEFQPQS